MTARIRGRPWWMVMKTRKRKIMAITATITTTIILAAATAATTATTVREGFWEPPDTGCKCMPQTHCWWHDVAHGPIVYTASCLQAHRNRPDVSSGARWPPKKAPHNTIQNALWQIIHAAFHICPAMPPHVGWQPKARGCPNHCSPLPLHNKCMSRLPTQFCTPCSTSMFWARVGFLLLKQYHSPICIHASRSHRTSCIVWFSEISCGSSDLAVSGWEEPF